MKHWGREKKTLLHIPIWNKQHPCGCLLQSSGPVRESLICTVFGKSLHICLVLSLEARLARSPSLLLCLAFYKFLVRVFDFFFTSPNKPKERRPSYFFLSGWSHTWGLSRKKTVHFLLRPVRSFPSLYSGPLFKEVGVGKRSDCLAIFKCSQKQKIIKEPEIPYTSIILLLRRSKANKR